MNIRSSFSPASWLRLCLGSLLAVACGVVGAETYPSKPIQLIIPFAPSGSTTLLVRSITPRLSELLGQQIVVINKPGGAATIGMSAVASAAPDGYTLGVATLAFAANPGMLGSKMPFDTRRDLTPVTLVARIPLVLTVNPSVGIHSLQELVKAAKEKPGDLNYGSAGIASSGHLGGALLESAAGIRMTHVPFGMTGSGASVVGGHVQLQIAPIPSSLGFIKAGKMEALGVSSREPSQSLPTVPTLMSQGLPGFEMYEWTGIVAPANTPRSIIERLRAEFARALADPAVRRHIEDTGGQVVASTPEEFRDFLDQEIVKWSKVAAHIKATETEPK